MEIIVDLNQEMTTELQTAISECTADDEFPLTPSQFATQCVENVLAERRLARIPRPTVDCIDAAYLYRPGL
jgi:hypothetical protein